MTARILIISLCLAGLPIIGHAATPVTTDPIDAPEAIAKACRSCHAPDALASPDSTPRVVLAERTEDGAPAESRPARGPDVVIIDNMTNLYGPVPFSHRIHADMSEMYGGCANCHHDSSDPDEIAACRTCHPAAPNTASFTQPSLKGAFHRQCLSCHRDWAHENACGYCHKPQSAAGARAAMMDRTKVLEMPHPRITAKDAYVYETPHEPGPLVTFHHVDHAERFGLKCVDCHGGDTCSGCHDTEANRAPVHREENCLTCHAEQNCSLCHAEAKLPRFDHAASTGWALDPNHRSVPCAQCHGPANQFARPSTNCRICHGSLDPERFNHSVTGVPLAGSHAHFDCQRCHRSSNPKARAECSGCHPDITYPQCLPGKRPER